MLAVTDTRLTALCLGLPNLDFTEARDSEWQWHQLDCKQVCTVLQTDKHASTPSLSFLQAGCHSCHPTNSVKALKELMLAVRIGQSILLEVYHTGQPKLALILLMFKKTFFLCISAFVLLLYVYFFWHHLIVLTCRLLMSVSILLMSIQYTLSCY